MSDHVQNVARVASVINDDIQHVIRVGQRYGSRRRRQCEGTLRGIFCCDCLFGFENSTNRDDCMCVLPQLERDGERIDIDPVPPRDLVTVAVQLAVMQATNRNGEFVADFAA
jgi:hypothetical protein